VRRPFRLIEKLLPHRGTSRFGRDLGTQFTPSHCSNPVVSDRGTGLKLTRQF
jgi:hypothetical protein